MGHKVRLLYPDPFKPTGLEIELPEDGVISVQIADDAGDEVAMIVKDKKYLAGKHTIILNLTEYRSGQYFYRLTYKSHGETIVETRKLVLGA